MKKIIFLFLFSISFLNADSFYMGRCVSSYNVISDGRNLILNVLFSSGSTYSNSYSSDTIKSEISILIQNDNKFTFNKIVNGRETVEICSSIDNSNYYGMTKEQFTFLMAFTGSLCGFTFLFFACFLAIGFGRK